MNQFIFKPEEKHTKRILISLTPTQKTTLENLSKSESVSMAGIVRIAIDELISKVGTNV